MSQNFSEVLAIIPARIGSKRIPKKNIKLFQGVPALERVIRIAMDSQLFSRVIVSTESTQVAQIAESAGAEVPFMRPLALADDFTPVGEVVANMLSSLSSQFAAASTAVCTIYPTAQLISPNDLKSGFELLRNYPRSTVMAAGRYPHPTRRSWIIESGGFAKPNFQDEIPKRTQDFSPEYFDAGQFYWASAEDWPLISRGSVPVKILELPRWKAIDLDTPDDWTIAEKLFSIETKSS